MLRRAILPSVVMVTLAIFSLVRAQEAAPQPGERPAAGAEGRRGFNPAQIRERFLSRIKDELGASDEEWKALQPKLDKIMVLQRDTRPGMFGGRSRPEAGEQPQSKVVEAQAALRTAVTDKNTPPEELARKVAAYREARDKARGELQAVQKEVKKAVNPRQEAVLVLNGMLE